MMLKQNVPSTYHISKGANNVFWILNDGENYLRKLSTNYKTAKKLAVDLIKENDPDFFNDGNELITFIWNRDGWEKSIKSDKEIYHFQHIVSYFIEQEKIETEKNIAEAKAKYSHVGDVGDILDLKLKITKIFGFDSNYGYCLAHKFEDADGNSLIYFGNSKQLCNDFDSKFNEGDTISITAEVKRHTKDQKEYVWSNGFDIVYKPVTVLSKPKLIKESA